MKKIRTYKMTHATGFAPNYDGGVLTLVTCKAGIREHAQTGEWIAGFTSQELNGDKVGEERLVYLMEVTNTLTYEEYWDMFPKKRPNNENLLGDNIYTTEEKAKKSGCDFCKTPRPNYVQIHPCRNHNKPATMQQDLKSNKVLISTNYRYFGKTDSLVIPNEYKIKTPTAAARFGHISEGEAVEKFVEYVFKHENSLDVEYGKKEEQRESCGNKKKNSTIGKR